MKKAFTMIELVFVLVIMGILSAIIMPSVKTNSLQEAAIQLASHLRYTQHLAMSDDNYNSLDDKWFKKRWQLVFSSSAYTGGSDVWAYTIFSDTAGKHTGDASESEIAYNPENSMQIMTGGYGDPESIDIRDSGFKGMKNLNIGQTYGIIGDNSDLKAVKLHGGCTYNRISFDYLGRPLKSNLSTMSKPYQAKSKRLISKDCIITLTADDKTVDIIIKAETGYISIKY